jgi:hypothetical protein
MMNMALPILTLTALAALSFYANGRFREHSRLPMQWSFKGRVNWNAPRAMALSVMPLLAVAVYSLQAILPAKITAAEPQLQIEAVFLALLFLGCHLLHIWLIDTSLSRHEG